MSDDEIRSQYRIIGDPSWQVQRMHDGKWVTGFWCGSKESAESCLEKCIQRYKAYVAMTPEERMRSILR